MSGCNKESKELQLKREEIMLKREQEQRLAQEQEQCRAREKEDAANLRIKLDPLIKSRKQRIKDLSAKLIDELKSISADRRKVDEEMLLMEDKRGLEYTVFNITTNPVLNRLAVKYTGSDFSALKSEFVETVRFHKTSHSDLTQNLKKNRKEYHKQVTGINQGVESANTEAQNAIISTHNSIRKKIVELERKKAFIVRRLSGRTENAETKRIDERLERLYQVLEVSTGSSLHIKATSLETDARRNYDTALEEKTVKDAEALKESQFKGDLYNTAQNYRERSFDRLLNAMITQYSVFSEKLRSVDLILEDLEESEVRMSLMEYSDLIKLRETITHDARLKLEDSLNVPTGVILHQKR